jgi:hypothetical protein
MDERPGAVYLSGVATGLAALVVVWFLMAVVGSDASAGPARAQFAALQGSTVARCATAADAISQPLRRAAASVSQWEIHVGAMNKLVAGDITFAQATAFWNQTRRGAEHRIRAFGRATSLLQRRGVDCPVPEWLPSHSSAHLRMCARRVVADLRALQAARTAIQTWRQHVHAMDMLRMGRVSPSTAEHLWLMMWHRGQHEIVAYHLAAAAASRIHGCGSTASPFSP